MSKNLTASDRKSLIRLASALPAGSPERRAILAGLQKGASRFNATVMYPVQVTVETPVAIKIVDGKVVGAQNPRFEDVALAARKRGAISSLSHPSLQDLEREARFQDLLGHKEATSRAAASAMIPNYTESDFVSAAYRAAAEHPGDFSKVFAILAVPSKVKPSGAFDPVDLGDLLTSYNFHRERAFIEPLIQKGDPIPYRALVGRSPFANPQKFPKDQIANAAWRLDHASQTLSTKQVRRALAERIGLRPGQMVLTNDLKKWLLGSVGVTMKGLQHFGLHKFGAVTMYSDLV